MSITITINCNWHWIPSIKLQLHAGIVINYNWITITIVIDSCLVHSIMSKWNLTGSTCCEYKVYSQVTVSANVSWSSVTLDSNINASISYRWLIPFHSRRFCSYNTTWTDYLQNHRIVYWSIGIAQNCAFLTHKQKINSLLSSVH